MADTNRRGAKSRRTTSCAAAGRPPFLSSILAPAAVRRPWRAEYASVRVQAEIRARRVLVLHFSGVLTSETFAHCWSEMADGFSDLARAVVCDMRGAVVAFAPWAVRHVGARASAMAVPCVFVAEGEGRDALKVRALTRTQDDGIQTRVAEELEVAITWAEWATFQEMLDRG